MPKSPEYRKRIRHHARSLEKAFPIVMGFVCGISEETPKTQKSTAHFKFKGVNWVVRGTMIHTKYDGVEVKPYASEGYVRIHHTRLEGRESSIIKTLADTRQAMEQIASGIHLTKIVE